MRKQIMRKTYKKPQIKTVLTVAYVPLIMASRDVVLHSYDRYDTYTSMGYGDESSNEKDLFGRGSRDDYYDDDDE